MIGFVVVRWFQFFSLLFLMLAYPRVSLAKDFPEEQNRKVWDRDCVDWPISLPGQNIGIAEKNPAIVIEKADGVYRVFVKMFFQAELGESFEELYQSVEKLVLQGAPYPQWVLPGINDKTGGGRYFVNVDGLVVHDIEIQKHFALTGPYTFQLLWFKRSGVTTVELRRDRVPWPDCPLFKNLLQSENISPKTIMDRAVYRMTPRPEILEYLIGEVYFLPHRKTQKVELRMRLVTKPSRFVYQLMPESMMRGEVEIRGKRIFQNLLDLRRNARGLQASSSFVPIGAKGGQSPNLAPKSPPKERAKGSKGKSR